MSEDTISTKTLVPVVKAKLGEILSGDQEKPSGRFLTDSETTGVGESSHDLLVKGIPELLRNLYLRGADNEVIGSFIGLYNGLKIRGTKGIEADSEFAQNNITENWLFPPNVRFGDNKDQVAVSQLLEASAENLWRFHLICAFLFILQKHSKHTDTNGIITRNAAIMGELKDKVFVSFDKINEIAKSIKSAADKYNIEKSAANNKRPKSKILSTSSRPAWLDSKFISLMYLSKPSYTADQSRQKKKELELKGDDKSLNVARLFKTEFEFVLGAIILKKSDSGSAFKTIEWKAVALTYNGDFIDRGNPRTKSALFSESGLMIKFVAPSMELGGPEYYGLLTGDKIHDPNVDTIYQVDSNDKIAFDGFYCWTGEDGRHRLNYSPDVVFWRGHHHTQIIAWSNNNDDLKINHFFDDDANSTLENYVTQNINLLREIHSEKH